MRFSGKVAIVTGGGSGIGFATAELLARDGATVVIADIRKPVEAASAAFESCDVTDDAQVRALTELVVGRHGRIDVLVNNAGIPVLGSVLDTTEVEWDRAMAVNVKGVFLCSRAAIGAMRLQGRGAIVNVASELGLVGAARTAAYGASKGAVIQLTRAMAIDHAPDGIRVNCVCPGPVDTKLLDAFFAARGDAAAAARDAAGATALGRIGRPAEIAALIAFAASDEASYMTGSVLVADGGVTAR